MNNIVTSSIESFPSYSVLSASLNPNENMLNCENSIQPTSIWEQLFESSEKIITLYSQPPKRTELNNFLEELKTLEFDWDGYSGLPIYPAIINHVSRLIEYMEDISYLPNPEISPQSNGIISLLWETSDGEAYFEVGVTRFSGYIKIKHQKPIFLKGKSYSLSPDNLKEIYAHLYQFPLLFSSKPRSVFFDQTIMNDD